MSVRRVAMFLIVVVAVLVAIGLWRRATAGDTTPGTTTRLLESGGFQRTYLLDTPGGSAPHAGRPLLILLHGGGGTADSLDKQTGGLPALADAAGYVVARPQGLNRQWNDGREVNKDVDDVAFISAMVDDIASRQSIDRGRLYAAGISNGGFMSGRLACEADLGIAAIAQVAATLSVDTDATCNPGHPVSVLAILGRADPIVPYAGGPVRLPWDSSETGRGIVLGGEAYLLRWVQRNGTRPPGRRPVDRPRCRECHRHRTLGRRGRARHGRRRRPCLAGRRPVPPEGHRRLGHRHLLGLEADARVLRPPLAEARVAYSWVGLRSSRVARSRAKSPRSRSRVAAFIRRLIAASTWRPRIRGVRTVSVTTDRDPSPSGSTRIVVRTR